VSGFVGLQNHKVMLTRAFDILLLTNWPMKGLMSLNWFEPLHSTKTVIMIYCNFSPILFFQIEADLFTELCSRSSE
jgi:hypothetical protein